MLQTRFYETFVRASCYECEVQRTGGSIELTIDFNREDVDQIRALVREIVVPFDALCCGANLAVAEVEFIMP